MCRRNRVRSRDLRLQLRLVVTPAHLDRVNSELSRRSRKYNLHQRTPREGSGPAPWADWPSSAAENEHFGSMAPLPASSFELRSNAFRLRITKAEVSEKTPSFWHVQHLVDAARSSESRPSPFLCRRRVLRATSYGSRRRPSIQPSQASSCARDRVRFR